MKIKNMSSQNLNLSLTKESGEKTIISLKPNQVLYADNNKDINKQLLIYEKKKLVYVNREMDKPSYVDYYKPFFESGSSTVQSPKSYIDLDDEDDDMDELIVSVDSIDANFADDEDFDSEITSTKKGRGRPKGTVKKDLAPQMEKKGRGRPKGTTKSKPSKPVLESSEQKKGRGRPKGSVKVNNLQEVTDQQSKRGRPKGTVKLTITAQETIQPEKKRGRGRPKGSVNIVKSSENENNTSIKRKRGRPRKFQFDN
jgi:hypothetical protein